MGEASRGSSFLPPDRLIDAEALGGSIVINEAAVARFLPGIVRSGVRIRDEALPSDVCRSCVQAIV